jgi:flavin-dependent dehydrogenase
MQDSYDLVILGGGLAGLCLGLQVKQARPETSIFIAEKREGPAPAAAFKVGESCVELSTNYFGEVIGMMDHLKAEHVHKMGLRYFFPAGDNSDIAQRVENGPPFFPPVPSYQLDRGVFENELAKRNLAAGNDLFDGCRVEEVELGDDVHTVTVTRGGETHTVTGRWLVDAAGRAAILKRKLGLEEDNDHNCNSSWLRLAGGLEYEKWVKDDPEWFERIQEQDRGKRHHSTTHLTGKGYWVWMIPLGSGPMSIGIVADPRWHPFERINTLDGAIDWMKEHEPQLAAEIDGRRDQIEDFLKIENFSYACKRQFSGDRWCLVGEAGAFLDPFYSPGSDFIAISNTFTTDLVTRYLDGEDVSARADAHQDFFRSYYDGFLLHYVDQYELWGNHAPMNAKIAVNFAWYWAGVGLLFFHRKLTDLDFMADVRRDLDLINDSNEAVERVCLQWHRLDDREWRRGYVSIGDYPGLAFLHLGLAADLDDDALKAKLTENRRIMEAAAVHTFFKAAELLGDRRPAEDVKVDPYKVTLDAERWEQDGMFSDDGMSLVEARQVAENFDRIFVDSGPNPATPVTA